MQDTLERDWGVQQLLTSANWGGVIGNVFTGGLNLQVGGKLCCMYRLLVDLGRIREIRGAGQTLLYEVVGSLFAKV